jgi:hypothetical protein
MRRVRGLIALVVVGALASTALVQASPSVVPLPATVQPLSVAKTTEAFRTYAADGTVLPATSFKVVSSTGNCCENHLIATPKGELADFGGSYLNISADGGTTWRSVRPPNPILGGEGTVAVAPNGDILGVGWDPYTGDRLQSFKYVAATQQWLWAEQPLHTPFYDREWIAVVPGPIEVAGSTYPYISVLRGGYPSKDLYQISTDGLTYAVPSAKQLDALTTAPLTAPLAPMVGPHSDYDQAVTYSNLTPLGARSIMSGGEMLTGLPPASSCVTRIWVAQADLKWACYQPASGPSVQWNAVDSAGRLHAVTWSPTGEVAYMTSADGGRTVEQVPMPLPEGFEVISPSHRDLKANAAAGVVAITLHAQDTATKKSQNFTYVYDYDGVSTPVLDRWYRIGRGDLESGSNVSSTGPRLDFSTLAILPDGRIAVSFNDTKHTSPAVAIEPLPAPAP